MMEEQRLLGCRNFTMRPVVLVCGKCRVFEFVHENGKTAFAMISPRQMLSPKSFFKRLETIYYATNVWFKWDGDSTMLKVLKRQLYDLPMEEINGGDLVRWKESHPEIKIVE